MAAGLRSAVLVLTGILGCFVGGDVGTTRPAFGSAPTDFDGATGLPLPAAGATALSPDPPVPVVAVRVQVPSSVGVGQELTYRITVENQSRAAAHHVLIRNPLPAHARFVRAQPEPTDRDPELLWQLGTLQGGTRKEIVLVLAATGAGDIESCARVQFEHGQCVTTKVARPGISLRKTGPKQGLLYDNLAFQLIVTNTGPLEITNIVITETLTPGLEHALGNRVAWNLGKLAPGQARVIDYQAIAKQAGQLGGKATVTADGGLRDEAVSTVFIAEPKLAVKLSGATQRYVNVGTPYQIVVTNPGMAAVTNVTVSLPLPAQANLVSATQGARVVENRVEWALGILAPGASRAVDVVFRVPAAGEYRLEATARADRDLKARDGLTATFSGVPALTLDVTVSDNPVEVGRETRYLIVIRNPGTQAVTQVRIVATLPEQIAAGKAAGPAEYRVDKQQVTFEPTTVQPRGEVRYEIQAKALKPGDVRVRVDLTAEQLTAGAVSQEASTTIYQDVP